MPAFSAEFLLFWSGVSSWAVVTVVCCQSLLALLFTDALCVLSLQLLLFSLQCSHCHILNNELFVYLVINPSTEFSFLLHLLFLLGFLHRDKTSQPGCAYKAYHLKWFSRKPWQPCLWLDVIKLFQPITPTFYLCAYIKSLTNLKYLNCLHFKCFFNLKWNFSRLMLKKHRKMQLYVVERGRRAVMASASSGFRTA